MERTAQKLMAIDRLFRSFCKALEEGHKIDYGKMTLFSNTSFRTR